MIKLKHYVIAFYVLLMISCSQKNIVEVKDFKIMPQPQKMGLADGYFLLNNRVSVTISGKNPGLESHKNYLENYLTNYYQLKLSDKESKTGVIELSIREASDNDESYELTIDKQGIRIVGKSAAGVFYGIQTLIQMLPPSISKIDGFQLVYCKINDWPAYKWRGMHLDVCRHFFPVEFVKKMIDMAAHLKLNTFHWHLTEDQGWRIEIKKYPKLAEIGAWRKETLIGHSLEYPEKYDGKKHGGYYTQEQIKEVVKYAAQRHITIVPEIEMPGHALAALAAYPEFSCTGGPFSVACSWGVFDEVYCAGKESTFEFLEEVLDEVINLFPGKYIHIGGDECPKTRWKKCLDCQKRMKTLKLKNENELQSYFIKRIEKYLNSKGKKIIGWDEILEGGLAENAAVMSWRGEEGGIEAAMTGHYVVMCPNESNYFDHYQGKYNEPLAIGGLTTLEKVYNYQPVPAELDSTYQKFILGSQANLWTEYITSTEQAEYMLYPRLCALAENLWTKENLHDYNNFLNRMDYEYKLLDMWGINYRVNPPGGFEDINRVDSESVDIEMYNGILSSEIRYSVDGSEPTIKSERYDGKLHFKLDTTIELKAVTFMPNGKKSTTIKGLFEPLIPFKAVTSKNYGQGIAYMYYEGGFNSAKKFNVPEIYNGVVNNFRLPADNSGNFFGVAYTGYIKIPVEGVYTFHLKSDDGAVLYIHDKIVVDNDNFQWVTEKSGKIALKSGLHPFVLNYFQSKFGYFFDVKLEGPHFELQKIPDNWLWH